MARIRLFVVALWMLAGLSGSALAVPGEVQNLRGSGSHFAWDLANGALEYRVYRGDTTELAQGYGSCYIPGLGRTDFLEPAVPAEGQVWFYYVTALDAGGEGTAGSGNPLPESRPTGPCVTGDALGISIELPSADAYEKEGTDAVIRFTRPTSQNLPAVTLHFTLSGDDDSRRGSADEDDYRLGAKGLAGVEYSIELASDQTAVDILVQPVLDALTEVPETLRLTLLADPAYTLGDRTTVTVQINDAANTTANETLLLAFLIAEEGVPTFASGISVLRLAGDNDTARVDLNFSGLTTPQNAVHIHVANPVSGPHVESLPLGQVTDHLWDVRAAQFLLTDQQVLNTLLSGGLYINVHSTSYPDGEIRGPYAIQQGSTTLQIPPDPPPHETLTGADLDSDLARFLIQSTFGATPESMAELQQLVTDHGGDRIAALEAWIDRQMDPAQTPTGTVLAYTQASAALFDNNIRDRRGAWWTFARYGQDQLRQRVAFALSQILVVSEASTRVRQRFLGAAQYYDLLATGAFGNYRDLLYDVSLHPIMGYYLSHLRNRVEEVNDQGMVVISPDENYAREVMQLFSFGLLKRHLDGTLVLGEDGRPIQTYDNTVVGEMAQIFTGLGFSKVWDEGTLTVEDNNNFNLGTGGATTQTRWLYPMKMFQDFHDESEKVLFDDLRLPPQQTGMQDLEQVHDLLANHPTTAPFVSRRLIQRFVTSNPSRGYVYRVAQRFQQSGGDLGEVIKAILLDYEARSLVVTEDTGFGKQKEPLLRLMALIRLVNGASLMPLADLGTVGYAEVARFPAGATIFRLRPTDLGQLPLDSPTVFNFFPPDYTQPGRLGDAGLTAPEFNVSTESQVYAATNYRRDLLYRGTGLAGDGLQTGYADNADDIRPDFSALEALFEAELAAGTEQSAAEALIDTIDLYLNGGRLAIRYSGQAEPNVRSIIVETILNSSTTNEKVRAALYVIASSPQTAIQR